MAVSKFYAIAKTKDGGEKVVNAFEALHLADDIPWDYPTDKTNGVFYDLETELKVSPSRGRTNPKTHKRGQPFFRYLTGESSPLKDQTGSFSYTPELIAFLSAFETIQRFQIQENETSIMIFPERINKLQRVSFPDGEYSILKFYMKLEETYPYSAYYWLNGVLAIEFYVSSKSSRLKRAELAREGIPLFEAKAFFPKWIQETLPEEFESPEELKKIANEIRITYQDRDYKLYGRFKKQHQITPKNERKYRTLKSYEEQCQELEAKIKQLTDSFCQKSEKVNQLREEIARTEDRLRHYNEMEEHYKKLEKANELLRREKNQLQDEKRRLTEVSNRYLEERNEAQGELEDLRNRPWWQRIFNKK
ncbi:hypothetical protein [Streptococcus suis]|uniref:hypothetical protein n=2 Tax=Streptococcus suis TaxID=1307 RepID=UPI002AA42B76|nr:hypothetical protein [Streptococcus suis]